MSRFVIDKQGNCFQLDKDLATMRRLQLTDKEGLEVLENYQFFVYLVNEETPNGKCYFFENLGQANHFYCKTEWEFNYSYMDMGLQDELGAYIMQKVKMDE